MFFSDFKTNFNNLDKKFKSLTIIIFLLPISLLLGPATMEPLLLITLLVYLNLLYKKKTKIDYNIYIYLIFFFYFIAILSSFLSDHQLFSLKSSFPLIRFIFYIFIFKYFLEENNWVPKFYIIFILILLFVVALDGFIQAWFGYNSILLPKLGQSTITGFFGEEKKLGRYLVVFLSLTTGLTLLTTKNKKYIFCFILFIILINTLIIFTSERISILNGFVTLIIFTLIIKNIFGKKTLYLLFFPPLIILLFYLVPINNFNETLKNTIFEQITGKKTKIYFFSKQHENFAYTSKEIFKKYPILGIGPKNFRKECSNFSSKYKSVKNCSTHPHNIFFQLLAETGTVGIIIYLIFIFKLFKIFLKYIFFTNDLKKSSLIFFLLPTIFYLNPLLPSGNFFNNWNMMMGIFPLPFYLYYKKKYEDL